MVTIKDVIHRLLPSGTRERDGRSDWSQPPAWPPDLFAVVATIIQQSSCYSHAALIQEADTVFGPDYVDRVKKMGASWRRSPIDERAKYWPHLRRLWRKLLDSGDHHLGLDDEAMPSWCESALELMGIADEAAAGMGFTLDEGPLNAYVLARQYERWSLRSKRQPAKHARARRTQSRQGTQTVTLCLRVPSSVACVQPKARTPQVGCTVRSLSHHLALLPPESEVRTRWLVSPRTSPDSPEPLNLLVVPMPYQLDGRCFVRTHRQAKPERWGAFEVRQSWLTSPARLRATLRRLIAAAETEVGRVHGLVLPELALDARHAAYIADSLGSTGLEFFVTGMLMQRNGVSENRVLGCLYERNRFVTFWEQSKHHRWKLDHGQIARYHLGHALDPELDWWEDIRLGCREITFYAFRPGASMAVLVCEDLARIDPVQPVIRAIGPNLVIALLMDGPQLEQRWPGRYATVLADDPGSAVLTLTSLGMVLRSHAPGEALSRSIGLWKDGTGAARPLVLPEGSHALLLTLSSAEREERTLDRRSDETNALHLSLSGVRAVRDPKARR